MSNQKIVFITGIAGFFGRHLCQVYLKNNYQVIGYDIKKPAFKHKNFIYIYGYLSDTQKIITYLKLFKPGNVIHLAGLIKSPSAQSLFEVNVFGFNSLCEAIRLSDLKIRVALISSSAVYKSSCEKVSESYELTPITTYGITKKIQEDLIVNYSKIGLLSCKIFRPFNLIGVGMPRDLAIASFVEKLQIAKSERAKYIEVGNLTSVRDYIDVRDAANIVFTLFDDVNADFDVINVCSGVGHKIEDILKLCCNILDFNPDIHITDNFIQKNDVCYQVGNTDKLSQYYNISGLHSIHSSLELMLRSAM